MKRVLISLSFILALAAVAFGQATRNSKNTADQTMRASGRVNPSTLGMEFDLPFGSYKGRGFDLPLGLSYSSKVWRFEEDHTISPQNNWFNIFAHGRYSENAASGWSSSLSQPYIEYTGEAYRFDNYGRPLPGPAAYQGAPPPPGDRYIRRITIFLPGGESHELRADDDPHDSIFLPAPLNIWYPPASAWEGWFYTSDGSGLKYHQDTANSVFRLFLSDGSFYDFNAGPYEEKGTADGMHIRWGNKLTDVNGNFAQYHSPDINYPNGSWTDQLGRTFPVMIPRGQPQLPANSQVLTQSFTLPGMSSSYTLTWERLKGNSPSVSAFTNTSDEPWYTGESNADNPTPTYTPALFTSGQTVGGGCGGDPVNHLYIMPDVDSNGASIQFNPVVLAQITLPNNAVYKFTYNKYGEVEHIIYPTGGHEEFTYEQIASLAHQDPAYQQANRGVVQSKVFENDGDQSPPSQYSAVEAPNTYLTSVTGQDGMRTDNYMYRGVETLGCGYTVGDTENRYGTRWGYDNVLAGRTYETRTFSSASPHILQQTITKWESTPTTQVMRSLPSPGLYLQRNPRVYGRETITYDGAQGVSSAVILDYDLEDDVGSPLNVSNQKEYEYRTIMSGGDGFIPGTSPAAVQPPASIITGVLARETVTTFNHASAYTDRNLLRLPTDIIVKDSSGTPKAKSHVDYDGLSLLNDYVPGDAASPPGWTDPGTTIRGLPTSKTSWTEIPNVSVQMQTQYNMFGSPRKSWDANGNMSEVRYTDNFSDSLDRSTFAYPTLTISAVSDINNIYGANEPIESKTQYNYNTGLPTQVKNLNTVANQNDDAITSMEYNDPLIRPTKVTAPNGQQTVTEYGVPDASGQMSSLQRFTKIKSQIDSINWKQGYTWFDGLSRTVRNENVDDAGNVTVMTCYDRAGQVEKISNPFRGYSSQVCNDPNSGLEWTTNTYDSYSRPWKVTTPDGAFVETTYGVVTTGNQIGTWVFVKDQALKERRSITNALGQLKRVDEPTTAGLGVPSAPNQPTNYSYDVLNNLLTVQQIGSNTQCGVGVSSCSQTRSFTYDALSRLKTAANPESGTINYGYDSNGNLTTKTVVGRNIATTYTFDPLNRVRTRSYNDGTPTVSYYYDNLANAKGKLIKVTSSVSTIEYTSFDISGMVTGHKQTTDGTAYTTGYTHNLEGGLVEETYPSTRVVKNVLDVNGDLSMVESKKNSTSGYWTYASSLTYSAAGAVTSMQLGNGHWESTTYNNRLQPIHIALGTAPAVTDLLNLNYSYGTTANNGNLLSQTITVPGMANPLIQTYTYDALNRLGDAVETNNATQTWKQEFSYDRYGNRQFVTGPGHTTTLLPGCPTEVCNPTINPNDNKLNSPGYTFDGAGNLTYNAQLQKFTYDAENKQTKVETVDVNHVVTGTLGEYSYDGDGKRVKKFFPSTGETTVFVYDAVGKQIAEYSTVVAGVSTAKVNYLTDDHLGSPRINTDQNGAVVSRHDYHPFGEEIEGFGGRTQGLNYGDDAVRKQFTGYERDGETGMDFAQARMYSSSLGRFGVSDPESAGADLGDPQTWNGYSYVVNNPMNLGDPSGLAYVRKGNDIYWVDDKQWADCQNDKTGACQKLYKDYEYLPYGTEINIPANEKGEFYALAGERVSLERGRNLVPVRNGTGIEGYSQLHQLVYGFESRAMWFWRPLIYGTGTAVMLLPASTPVAFGIGGVGAASVGSLGINMGRQFIVSRLIGPVQKMLLDQFFKSGLSNAITLRTVTWAMEVCRTAIQDGRDTTGAQAIRLVQLQELFDKMVK